MWEDWIHKDTYYQWIKADKELSDRLEALRNKPVLSARTSVVESFKAHPELALKYLERKRKKEFAERKEVTGEDGAPLFDDNTKKKADEAIGGYLAGDTEDGE